MEKAPQSGFASHAAGEQSLLETIPALEAERINQAHEQANEEYKVRSAQEAEGMDIIQTQANADNTARTIEQRKSSPELQKLNDLAELRIYGSSGRTYTGPDGDPIATPEQPIKGLLAEMRQEPQSMFGRPQTARDEAKTQREKSTSKYESELLGLVDNGMELSQAALSMDLRSEAADASEKRSKAVQIQKAKLEANGASADTSQERAESFYDKKNPNFDFEISNSYREGLITKQGIFTKQEYADYISSLSNELKQAMKQESDDQEKQASQQATSDESRSKIDVDMVRDFVKEFDDLDAPTSDLIKDIPAEAFHEGTTRNHRRDLMPQSYWDWFDSRPDVTRNRIDKDDAAEHMIQLSEAGLPHDILQDFPAEFFYKEGDPDQASEYPDSYKEYLKDKPDLAKELHSKGLYDEYEASESTTDPVETPEPNPAENPSSPKKRFWGGKPGVIFDKLGNAQVVRNGEEIKDPNERLMKASKNVAILALSALGYTGALKAQAQRAFSSGELTITPKPAPVQTKETAKEDRDETATLNEVKSELQNVTPDLRGIVLSMVHNIKGFEELNGDQQRKFIKGGLVYGLFKHEHISVEDVEDPETGKVRQAITFDEELQNYIREFRAREIITS